MVTSVVTAIGGAGVYYSYLVLGDQGSLRSTVETFRVLRGTELREEPSRPAGLLVSPHGPATQ